MMASVFFNTYSTPVSCSITLYPETQDDMSLIMDITELLTERLQSTLERKDYRKAMPLMDAIQDLCDAMEYPEDKKKEVQDAEHIQDFE